MNKKRFTQDALLRAVAALPNAANVVNSNSIDLGANPAFTVEKVQVLIASTAATGANSKNIGVVLQHSDEPSANFTNIAELGNPLLKITDNANAGYPEGEAVAYLPPSVKRYIRGSALGEANGGNAGDGTFTVALLF